MNSKKANRAFLISILLYIGVVFGLVYVYLLPVFAGDSRLSQWITGLTDSIIFSNLLCELVVLLPGLLYLLFSEEKKGEFLHLKKMKPGTALAVLPFTLFSMPVITLVNLLSQFVTENEATAVMESYEIGSMPFLPLLLSVGIFAPFCEELICRGIYYRSYKKSGSAFAAMLLSAMIFALVHMNINQAAYAFVMGILAVLLVEASGSLWSSVIYHALINSSQVALMYVMLKGNASAFSEATDALTTESLVTALAGYLVITAVTLPIAWAILVWMSGNEGRRGVLLRLWKERKTKKDKLVTVPLILAIILCLVIILFS
jgi:hypothetical protein